MRFAKHKRAKDKQLAMGQKENPFKEVLDFFSFFSAAKSVTPA